MKCPICDSDIRKNLNSKYPKYCSDSCKTIGRRGIVPNCANVDCNNNVERGTDGRWLKYCSSACRNLCILHKRKDTWLKTLGVDHPSKAADFIDKCKQTSLEKYGAEHHMQLDSTKQLRIQNSLVKYGVDHHLKSDIVKEKRTNTCIDRYGMSGSPHPKVSVAVADKLADKEFLTNEHKTKPVHQIAKELDVCISWVYQQFSKLSIVCNGSQFVTYSGFEEKVQQFLTENNIEFTTNSRNIIPPLEIDIFVPAANLAIECNGSYWHSELQGKDSKYHLNKTLLCNKQHIHLIHLWEHNWESKLEITKSRILSLLGKSATIYARQCKIHEITRDIAMQFLNTTHIQGYSESTIKYGLFHKDTLVAVMTFGKSRFDKQYQYELIRYSTIKNTNIVGGASRLFSHFVKSFSPTSVISYSDKSWNRGSVYIKLGFTYAGSSAPGCYYTKNYTVFKNRQAYQKHKLANILENYDSNMTAWDNLKAHNYDRIWDCGNDIFIWLNSNNNI